MTQMLIGLIPQDMHQRLEAAPLFARIHRPARAGEKLFHGLQTMGRIRQVLKMNGKAE